MNVGQILETHLGWGARVLGDQIRYMLEEKFGANAMRDHIKKIFDGDAEIAKWLAKLSDEDVRVAGEQAPARRPLRQPRCSTARRRAEIKNTLGARGPAHAAARRSSSTAAPASPSTRRSPWA